ncbi:MAG: hypothetical protein AAF798_00230 [Bacteroidota bacterium]
MENLTKGKLSTISNSSVEAEKSAQIKVILGSSDPVYNNISEIKSHPLLDQLIVSEIEPQIKHLKQTGFQTFEKFDSTLYFPSRVFGINDTYVECDSLIDRENSIFEKRTFPRMLFEHLPELKEGTIVRVKVQTKPGATRIDVMEDNRTDPKIFELNDRWESLRNSAIDQPFSL